MLLIMCSWIWSESVGSAIYPPRSGRELDYRTLYLLYSIVRAGDIVNGCALVYYSSAR